MAEVAENLRPTAALSHISRRLGTLQRMRDHKQLRLAEGLRPGAATFVREELLALEAAIVALQHYRSTVEDFAQPIDILREIVLAYDGPSNDAGKRDLERQVRRARHLLEEL